MVAFPKYESYQDSGVKWLGKIPSHWRVQPGRAYLKPQRVKNIGNKVSTVLSLSYGKIVIKPEEKLHGLVPESFETYQIVEPGNIIVRATDLQNDHTSLRIGLVEDRGIITSAYLCLVPSEKMDSRFTYYLLHTYDLLKVYYGMGSGLRQNLDYTDFKYLPLPIPEIEEQKRIAEFLDCKTSEIDQAIAKKQRLIELLQEQKAILINQAVTKGLNFNVPMCVPPGTEWIGDIPKHWEVMRLKFLMTHIVDCLHSTPDYVEDGQYPAIRTADVSPGILNVQDSKRVGYADYVERIQRLKPQENDIIYSREGERYGMSALVPVGIDLCLAQRVMMFRIKSQYVAKYFMWVLNSECVYGQVKKDTVGATSPRVNIETIKETWLPVPPQNEQIEISDKISELCHERELVIDAIRRNIEELEGYRTSLINATVTGKIKV